MGWLVGASKQCDAFSKHRWPLWMLEAGPGWAGLGRTGLSRGLTSFIRQEHTASREIIWKLCGAWDLGEKRLEFENGFRV